MLDTQHPMLSFLSHGGTLVGNAQSHVFVLAHGVIFVGQSTPQVFVPGTRWDSCWTLTIPCFGSWHTEGYLLDTQNPMLSVLAHEGICAGQTTSHDFVPVTRRGICCTLEITCFRSWHTEGYLLDTQNPMFAFLTHGGIFVVQS